MLPKTVAEQGGGGGGGGGGHPGRHLYRVGNFELQMYFCDTNRGAHIYLATGGTTWPESKL